jgi:hypothetical protein
MKYRILVSSCIDTFIEIAGIQNCSMEGRGFLQPLIQNKSTPFYNLLIYALLVPHDLTILLLTSMNRVRLCFITIIFKIRNIEPTELS